MKKFRGIISLIVLISMIFSIPAAANGAKNDLADVTNIEMFVSPDGSDSADGTIENPLATLDGARSKVAGFKSKVKNGTIYVNFLEGEYPLSSTVNFTEEDSGTANVKITYRAYSGARVSFSGSKPIDTSKFTPVHDLGVAQRIPPEARDRVGQLDLKRQGFSEIAPYVRTPHYQHYGTARAYLFVDDQMQPVSGWPNSGYSIIQKIVQPGVVGYDNNPADKPWIFQHDDARVDDWKTAKNAIIEGFFMYHWAYAELELDHVTDNRELVSKKNKLSFGMLPNQRWKITNLIEELDMPGEFYIDTENLMLYYYPPYPVTEIGRMDISTLTDDMIKATDLSYVAFEKLRFERTRGNGVNIIGGTDVKFLGCTFENIGNKGIVADKVWNMEIRSNDFFRTGNRAINVNEVGDRANQIAGGLKVVNNHFYENGIFQKTYSGAFWQNSGVGTVVENNAIHNADHQAVCQHGNDTSIKYNDIYNVLQETSDSGAIYMGRTYADYGTEVAYNYIHDIGSAAVGTANSEQAMGIYLDDMESGISLHHNVLANLSTGLMLGGGRDVKFYDNIIINASNRAMSVDARGMHWGKPSTMPGGEAYNVTAKYPVASSAWTKKYPVMKGLLSLGDDLGKPQNNIIADNLIYNSNPATWDGNYKADIFREAKRIANNVEVKEGDFFVNPEGKNYNIKPDSKILKALPGLAEIDVLKTGLYLDEYRTELATPDLEFKKIWPRNGSIDVNNQDTVFRWEAPILADRYRLIIATDPEMQNVVQEYTTDTNTAIVKGLDPNKTTYYWTVEALSIGRQINGQKTASGEPYSFTTVMYETLDRVALENQIALSESKLNGIVEGDEWGLYAYGTRSVLEKAITEAKDLNAQLHPTQKMLDEKLAALISAGKEVDSMVNKGKGYRNFADILNLKPQWISQKGAVKQENNSVTLTGEGSAAGNLAINPSVDEVLVFKMKTDYKDSWVALVARQTRPNLLAWENIGEGASDGYLVIIKPNQIELQKFMRGSSVKSIDFKPNTYIKPNVVYNVEFGAIDTEYGVRVIFKVDGETVYDWTDSTTDVPINEENYFSFWNIAKDGYITLSGADNMPDNNELWEESDK